MSISSSQRKTMEKKEKLDDECLLDGFLALFEECTHDGLLKIKQVSSFVQKYNKAVNTAKEERMKVSDFEVKAVIGRGHFGEVRVVTEKSTDEVYAMKVLRKSELLSQPEISFFEVERDIMAKARSCWITQLHYAFQDSVNLYLVMDFHAGGDLLSLLRRHDDIFDEDMGKFYIAEMAMAINSLHEMGYIHRDIKPENVLLDYTGHIKLADFGSAAGLDLSGKVSAHIPVGTPDYVAPELLLAMNKSHRQATYGVEVDWWSLGICAFEMLFGATPFTTESASTVSTYANIMDYKRALKFPADSDVSAEAKDLIKKLLTNSEDRLRWPDIKSHPFFSGINWDTIRQDTAFYVPSINGLDDTSHFDEVEKVQRQPDIQALKPQKDFSGRDLPFVGFTYRKQQTVESPDKQCNPDKSDKNNSQASNTSCLTMGRENQTLQLLAEKDEEIQHLKYMLEKERENWNCIENRSVSLLTNLSSMNAEIRSFEDELLEVKLEEMKGEIILLECELEKTSSKLRAKEHELAKASASLEETSQQLQHQQMKLDREKRKSREDQRKDLKLIELRNQEWESLLEEKQVSIDELSARVQELEKLVEAYEDSEEKQAIEVEQLEHKMNTSLPELSSVLETDIVVSGNTGQANVHLDNFHHLLCPSHKKLTVHLTVKAGRCSFLDNSTVMKLQELQKMIDKYAQRARKWHKREEELTIKIANLESDNHMLKQREGIGRKVKDSLVDNVTSYQQEVQTLKTVIKELQETMRTYLTSSSTLSDTEKNLKELQHCKLRLETELLSLREESERTRQAALHKTSQMEETIRKLEEENVLSQNLKERYDSHMEATEKKISLVEEDLAKATADRQRLERRETSLSAQVETLQGLLDDRNMEIGKLERRNMDIQSHLQQLQQRNSELQVQMESLQKVSSQNDEQKQSVAELNFQISRLQQQKTDLERRVTAVLREKQSLDDKIGLSEREKERLGRRIKRLEDTEQAKQELEAKVEKMLAVERDNRRLELKLERLPSLEKEKLNLEEKLDKLQLDLRKEKITAESLMADKQILETKIAKLESSKVTNNSEEISQLKLKITLMETAEKERSALEREVKLIRQEKEHLEAEKVELERLREEAQKMESQNKNLQKQKDILEKEKQAADDKLVKLTKEKAVADDCVAKLNKEVDRLESALGTLEKLKSEPEMNKLSSEINRLKRLVDKLESNKTQETEKKRSSSEIKSGLIDKLQREKSDLQKQVERLEREASRNIVRQPGKISLTSREDRGLPIKPNEDQVRRLEAELADLRGKLKEGDSAAANKEILNKSQAETISSLSNELADKRREVNELKTTIEVQEASLAEQRAEIVELMKSENALLEQLEKEAQNSKNAHEEITRLSAQLKERPTTALGSQVSELNLVAQVKDLQHQLKESQREVEIRKGANEFSGGDIPAYLRHELNESNLALSEARSLLAASKRQEFELKNRIDKLQKSLDNQAVENVRYLQNSQDAVAEMKSLKSQHDTLKRQYQVLEDKYASLQKEQGSNSTEAVHLSEEMSKKQQQYEMEHQKVKELVKVCSELDVQASEMEAVIAKYQQREQEWENIKKTYERAVDERENELEGVSVARSADSDKISSLKHQLETIKALHKADVEKLNHSLREETSKVKKLTAKIEDLEEKEKLTAEISESQMKEMDKTSREVMKLKEELTESLSNHLSQRKEVDKLKRYLTEAMEQFELIVGEKVNMENFAETLQGLHFLEKYKFESTIGQQMKLIDYLQELYMEHNGKKKKSKFFGMKTAGKDVKSVSTPVSWLDLHTSLEQEQTKSHQLQDQVNKLKKESLHQANENGVIQRIKKVLRLKKASQETTETAGRIERVQANISVRVSNSAVPRSPDSRRKEMMAGSTSSLASSSSSSSSSQSGSHFSGSSGAGCPYYQREYVAEYKPPPLQRMHHNIPHRFATGLNTRAAKCGLCLGTVQFVRQASKCQECGLVVHPKCASSVPATCGLPTEYVRHFALMMSRIYRDDRERESDIDRSAVRMEGWLKVPRVGKAGWENRYCVLEGTWLTLYLNDTDASPVDSFDLNAMDADVSVHSAVTSAELANTASSDLHYILRLDQDPLTTCWPGRYLYLMTTNFQEKQQWVASLEAVVKGVQRKRDLYRNKSQILTVLSLKSGDQREFNCSLVISSQLVLLGTEDGLYALNPQTLTSKHSKLTQLTGFGSVHQMALAKGVDLILLLTGPERRLVMLENKLVKCRMSQTLGGETTPFSFKMVEGLQSCTIFDVGLWNNASYLCVGTPTKLYLMKYNPSLAMYCVRKEFPSSEPCSCVCIADNYAIAGTERFYKINLEHPSLLDFVDRQDSSLAFAAYGAANHSSYPLAVVRTSSEKLPLEFLLCFHEFGVFVDDRGQRSRATDIKWSGLPLAFAFVDPFLYVTYTNTVQATVVPTDRAVAKGRQTILDIQSPRYLGPAPSLGCVYVSTSDPSSNVTEILCIKGQESFSTDDSSDKENAGSKKRTKQQVYFASPKKTPKRHQHRHDDSLSSLNSNSSGSTHASVESGV